jgi:hypothetical protein
MDTNTNMNMNGIDTFQTQMEFVKERNKIRYENKLMKEEDEFSQKCQQIFREQEEKAKMELAKYNEEQAEIFRQIMIQSQIEKDLKKFVDDYVVSRMNAWNRQKSNYPDLNVSDLRREGENIFYDRLLKQQQDEEYQKTINQDKNKKR